ncbi:hypothetical protein AWH56_023615 [Anaerobacillus isosaccharinicus]|uniref:Chemotaxis protein CheX n=1 Tax=Anaerobacillus isosaccharinicus TaxID=1532552 RepID=A0A1S2LKC2_9BACI|nr:hypothetical protein [Anaerobacillus isosaccharinicus]MBA5586107.1 hypothetical protein [Anaerobacillus isosaccharinicus]QOY35625.1 hypothetical protein AWH56_023615 [Anaerobacillus isosaccharinicus]
MFSKFFGNFLLNKGIITSQQLNEVFQEEKSSHVKLGILALNKGFMTLEQIEEVNEAQMATDKRFGEIAIEKGYLNIDKLEELLTGQKTSYLLISQILLDKNILTMEQISKHLFNYKNENGLTNEDLQELTSDNIEKIISNSLQLKNSTIEEYIVLLVKNIERHLHEKTFVEELKELPTGYPLTANQKIVGEYSLDTYFMLNEQAFIKLASIFAEEVLTEIDELCISAVLEYLNLHNGIFIVNEVDKGFDIDLEVQRLVEAVSFSDGTSYFKFTFADIELVVGLQKK